MDLVAWNRRRVLEGRGNAVPCVDDGDGGAEPGEFAGLEVRGDGGVVFVGDVAFAEAGQELCPLESGSFTLGKDAGFAPDDEQVEPGSAHAQVACFVEVKLGAE